MSENLSALFYLAASVAFILALRGLSSPQTARAGNFYGIAGMAIAVATTLASPHVVSLWLILLGFLLGGAIGTWIALRIQMTALPQLVAAFHSLVGLAAVCVAAAAFSHPEAYGIGTRRAIFGESLVEMAIGTAIGAVTFTGSVVAFAKLQGLVTGRPFTFPFQHPLNAALGLVLVLLIVLFVATQAAAAFWLIALLSLALGLLLIAPIGGADMPVVISMLNSYSGWAACGIGFTLSNSLLIITGALVGSSGAILSYIMCKGMNRSIFNVILGGFGTEGGTHRRRRRRRRPLGQVGQRRRRRLHPEERRLGDCRAGLRHGRGAGPARAQRDGRSAEKGRGRGALCDPSGRRAHARPYERAVGRGERAL